MCFRSSSFEYQSQLLQPPQNNNMFYQNRPFHPPYNNQNAVYQSLNGLYRPTMDSSASSQANQPYSSLNRVTLDMNFDELMYSQEYYPAQDYSMGQGSAHSSGHSSAPVEDDDDDSPVKDMSPVKAKKASKRASKAKKNDTKEKEPPKDWTIAKDIALCRAWGHVSENYEQGNGMKAKGFWDAVMKYFERETGSVRGYDSILSKWKNRVRPRIGQFCAIINNIEQNHKSGVLEHSERSPRVVRSRDAFFLPKYKGAKKSKTSETTSGLASGGFNLNNEADEFEKETQEHRPMGRDYSKAKNKSSTSSREGSSSFVNLVAEKFLNIKSTKWEKMQEQQGSYIQVKNRELDMQEAARKEAAELKRSKLEIQRRTLELAEKSNGTKRSYSIIQKSTALCPQYKQQKQQEMKDKIK
ncbi:hypothetical protein Tco_1267862 [Tanacetum coccineum]